MMPPKTPICRVVIPSAEVVEFSVIASTPPFAMMRTLIAVFITRYAIAPERAATSFSFLAMPIATPIANSSARLSKTALPVLLIMSNIV